jgi:phosphatidyl-myo-inositol alpha-mannosyltransferase
MPNQPGIAGARWRRIGRRVALPVVSLGGVALAAVALERIGISRMGDALLSVNVLWALTALLLMCSSMVLRAEAWYMVLRAAGTLPRRRDTVRGTMIGVLMSASLPGRLGEPARAFVLSRRLGDTRRWFATVAGTVFAQTLLNIVALALLAVGALAGAGLFGGHTSAIAFALALPVAGAALVVGAPELLERLQSSRIRFMRNAARLAAAEMSNLRRGLFVFRRPGAGLHATLAQLCAWALQWLACYALILAFGLEHRSGLAAAAGVLLAVNVTAVLPATPSNVGIFQAACIVVLAAYGVGKGQALAYGIVLQAIEVATALLLGVPALVSEGLSWSAIRHGADELANQREQAGRAGDPQRRR